MRDESIENFDDMKLNLVVLRRNIMNSHLVVLHAMESEYKCALNDIQYNKAVAINHDIGFG